LNESGLSPIPRSGGIRGSGPSFDLLATSTAYFRHLWFDKESEGGRRLLYVPVQGFESELGLDRRDACEGVSIDEMLAKGTEEQKKCGTQAVLKMKKFDIATVKKALEG
jgi:hypothetical protein